MNRLLFAFALLLTLNTSVGGCCGGPVEVNARKLFDALDLLNEDELTRNLSDPKLCETIDCYGLTIDEAHNTVKNIIEKHRFSESQDLNRQTQSQTFYLALVSILISIVTFCFTIFFKLKSRLKENKRGA